MHQGRETEMGNEDSFAINLATNACAQYFLAGGLNNYEAIEIQFLPC